MTTVELADLLEKTVNELHFMHDDDETMVKDIFLGFLSDEWDEKEGENK